MPPKRNDNIMYLLQVRCPIAQYADLYRRDLCRKKRDNSTLEKQKERKKRKKRKKKDADMKEVVKH